MVVGGLAVATGLQRRKQREEGTPDVAPGPQAPSPRQVFQTSIQDWNRLLSANQRPVATLTKTTRPDGSVVRMYRMGDGSLYTCTSPPRDPETQVLLDIRLFSEKGRYVCKPFPRWTVTVFREMRPPRTTTSPVAHRVDQAPRGPGGSDPAEWFVDTNATRTVRESQRQAG